MSLIETIKKSEDDGFKTGGMPYKDSLNKDTIGYGTLLPLSEKECEILLKHRLDIIIQELLNSKIDSKKILDIVNNLSKNRRDVLFEMAYQLGVPKTLKFKKMWKTIENNDFKKASFEMMNSRWYLQTQARVSRLANCMLKDVSI